MRAIGLRPPGTFLLLALASLIAACAVGSDPGQDVRPHDGAAEGASEAAADVPQMDVPGLDVSRCAVSQTECAGHCVDVRSDGMNCGACGTVCATGQFCDNGTCALSCNAPRQICTGAGGPVCTDPTSDVSNCGSCGTACGAMQSCVAGACVCPTGMALCGATCFDTGADPMNCGSCGNTCAATQRCIGGACVCPGGGLLCGGACVDAMNDAANCGACGNACVAGQMCSGGSCACPAGRTLCSGTCVDTRVDIANCGACSNACGTGQFCSVGSCFCPSGRLLCGGACVDVNTDTNNCGACGTVCPSGAPCTSGSCSCTGGLMACSGTCVNLQTDAAHCGACGNACTGGLPCLAGACGCAGGGTLCGSTCVNLATDRTNCGSCGTACAAAQNCVAGACAVAAPTGYSVASISTPFVDACTQAGMSRLLASVDDSTASVTVPFSFYLWNYSGTAAWVSSNGVFGGGTTPSSTLGTGCPLPSFAPANSVLAFLDDLYTRPTGVCVATVGSAPTRKFVATWSDAYFFADTTGHLTFSVILSEGTNTIDVVYQSMSGGAAGRSAGNSAEIGIINGTATSAVQYSCDTASIASGTAIRYTPM